MEIGRVVFVASLWKGIFLIFSGVCYAPLCNFGRTNHIRYWHKQTSFCGVERLISVEIKRRIAERITVYFLFKTIDHSGRSEHTVEWKRAFRVYFFFFPFFKTRFEWVRWLVCLHSENQYNLAWVHKKREE